MKKLILGLVLALGLSTAAYAEETCSKTAGRQSGELPSCLVFDGATANGSSAIIDTFGYKNLSLKIWADEATTSATIEIRCRSYNSSASGALVTSTWANCSPGEVDPTNPDNTTRGDHYISLARAFQYQINITNYVSGTIYASFERYTW